MIVYRDAERLVDPWGLLDECTVLLRAMADRRTADHALVVRLLIDVGELETAVTDLLFPDADDVSPAVGLWRRAAMALGRLFVASWLRHDSNRLSATAMEALWSLEPLRTTIPRGAVRLRVAEGYAYYALYPETYFAAAHLFRSGRTPGTAVCVGVRSIGTSLSAVVGAALKAEGWHVPSVTLRPRGAPFQRRPVLTSDLARWVESRRDADFLIIDEGPGLSGSSMCGVAGVISGLGVPDRQITFFPSWSADEGTFNSEESRQRWRRHAKFCCSFEDTWLSRGIFGPKLDDLSGGGWRRRCYADAAEYPAVHPQHERRKYLATLPSGEQILFKFAGLGRYGEAKHARAEQLAEAGFTPRVVGFVDGFLMQSFVPGRPLRLADADAALMSAAARYLAHLRCSSDESLMCWEPLLEMIEVNISEGLGPVWRDRLGDLGRLRPLLIAAPAVAVDGRMMPHEWLATPQGLVKTDATDHGDDHFFPGPQDIAWDVAGFAVEFVLSAGRTRDFAERVATLSGDRRLGARLPFYRLAYVASRLGYTTIAAQTLGQSEDGSRMAALARRYRRELQLSIAALRAAPVSVYVTNASQ